MNINNYCKLSVPYVTVTWLWKKENPFLSAVSFWLHWSESSLRIFIRWYGKTLTNFLANTVLLPKVMYSILVFVLCCCFLPWKQNTPYFNSEEEGMLGSGYKYFIIGRQRSQRGTWIAGNKCDDVFNSSEETYIKLSLTVCFLLGFYTFKPVNETLCATKVYLLDKST